MSNATLQTVIPSTVKNVRTQKNVKSSLLLYRLMILYRFTIALIGGYALASLSAIVITQFFIEDKLDAAMSSTLIAFCLHCATFIWVFMVHKTLKASLGIFIPCLMLFGAYKLLGN